MLTIVVGIACTFSQAELQAMMAAIQPRPVKELPEDIQVTIANLATISLY